jgi:hypothetical protein
MLDPDREVPPRLCSQSASKDLKHQEWFELTPQEAHVLKRYCICVRCDEKASRSQIFGKREENTSLGLGSGHAQSEKLQQGRVVF